MTYERHHKAECKPRRGMAQPYLQSYIFKWLDAVIIGYQLAAEGSAPTRRARSCNSGIVRS
jgi:hypothetical protein